ncbi:LysE/ArgO family amino acid transporter [Ralstonia pseudosolanacearum]|uniref:LysE/ArgO family amino acid transporter n=1 Tax=Ralstonia pseudosolanacearum TaxID=1310165 RepID=UPI0019109DA1|nr:amino acid transporter [Ralstonia solanacearum]
MTGPGPESAPLIGAALSGFGLGASLIVAIGAQNAYVLRQGLRREYVLGVVLICALCDMALIALGVAGMGTLISAHPAWLTAVRWAGAAFLLAYGARAFRAAWRGAERLQARNGDKASHAQVLASALALSLLNPHVYLDTVVLLGAIGGRYAMPANVAFAGGAMCASILWFSLLGFGARLLEPVFARPVAWRVLDALIGAVMWAIALTLLIGG